LMMSACAFLKRIARASPSAPISDAINAPSLTPSSPAASRARTCRCVFNVCHF